MFFSHVEGEAFYPVLLMTEVGNVSIQTQQVDLLYIQNSIYLLVLSHNKGHLSYPVLLQ